MDWVNVSEQRYGSVYTKLDSAVDGQEIDGGFDWTGRCLFVDHANPNPGVSRILDIQAGSESLDTRCMRHFIDVEGWIDGDDVAQQFSLCNEDVVSYASDAMTGTMLQRENAGGVNGWEIFSRGSSGDWGGEGVDVDVGAALASSTEVQDAVLDACSHVQSYGLGQVLPVGFISTSNNLINTLRVTGVRNLGFDPPGPPCTTPPEALNIQTLTLDDGGQPVIHYSDSNQPADVTGYNVYRASVPTGPWTLLGSNVNDMDAGTHGLQYVDPSGDTGARWYYRVAAWNETCTAEGP
jgi:hypothetical protein